MTDRNWRVAVVGAGPAGLYGAEALVKRGAKVDVFERQFAPFGLVRYGVAPDHQKIKRTQVVFERILALPEVRFFGHVEVGRDVTIPELQEEYDQILITMGSSGARDLGVPGEHLAGSLSATELVNWYNGHPDFIDAAPRLDTPRAVVVGMGNVAIDVARILLRDPGELATTDISQPALEVLRKSQIREVILLARRGPNQAAFDQKEVRELASLPGVVVQVDGYIPKRKTPQSEFVASLPRVDRAHSLLTGERRAILHFCMSPVEILGEAHVRGVRMERNMLVESAARMKAVGSGQFSEVEAGLLVRAIGYSGVALPGVPFCAETGTVENEGGQILSERHGAPLKGLFAAGWIKRGPTGLIGTNKSCAVDTVHLMEAALDQVGPERDPEAILRLLKARGVRYVSAEDWAVLSELEVSLGKERGAARVKFLSSDAAFEALDRAVGARP